MSITVIDRVKMSGPIEGVCVCIKSIEPLPLSNEEYDYEKGKEYEYFMQDNGKYSIIKKSDDFEPGLMVRLLAKDQCQPNTWSQKISINILK